MSLGGGNTPPFFILTSMTKPKLMRNTKTGKVCVYNKSVIDEMPWYEPIVDEPQPEQIPQESAAVETPKRKSWKHALAAKAAELEKAET